MHSLCIARYANDGKRKANAVFVWNPRYEVTDHVIAYRIDNNGVLPYDLLYLTALHPIAKGEEITIAYGKNISLRRFKKKTPTAHPIMTVLDILLRDDAISGA